VAKISFVIPVYRNEASVEATYNCVRDVLRDKLAGYGYEFVFVDDGSDDRSLERLEAIVAKDENARALSFSRNFGQVPAIAAGLGEVSGDVCVILSADLQDPPELLTRMLADWEQGYHVVICHREKRHDGWLSKLGSRLFYGLIHLINPQMPIGGFDYLLLSRTAVRELNKIDERNRFLQGDVLWLGLKTRFLPYERRARTKGRSQWTTTKKIKYFLDGLLSTSYWPIRAMMLLGLLVALAGFVYSVVIVYARLVHLTPFQGWAPLMIVTLVLGGMNMLMLGIIGEYIWRTYDEARGRASFVVARRIPEDRGGADGRS
jgi:polyisoprenyl-phosphate glycosyltransferase